MDTQEANLVGTGISPRWQIEDSGLKRDIQELWADWINEADADGACNFYGMQALVARELIESGEVFGRFRSRRKSDGLSVPLQLQLLEPDHLDESHTTKHENGNEIRMGIEFNKMGRRVAYHFFREHPGEINQLGVNSLDRVRVPASQVIHTYRPLRAGQKRGRPWLASVIVPIYELHQYDDAELVRKKVAAMFGGFITVPLEDETSSTKALGEESEEDFASKVVAMEPGTFPVLPRGGDVKFAEPADVGGNYAAFTKRQDRRVARGFGGLTYEKYTGDLEGVNYSSIRAGNLEYQRFCKMIIQNVLAFQFCRPVAINWLNQAVLSGALRIPDYTDNPRKYHRIAWCHDGWPWVDPEKEEIAARKSVRSGFRSRAEIIAENGRDVEQVDSEIAQDNERADSLKLVYDSDPRKTDGKGGFQSAEKKGEGTDERE
jgi:lambda family phage portal protein